MSQQTPFQYNAAITAVVQDKGNCPSAYALTDCLFPVVQTCTPEFKYRKFDLNQKYDTYNQYVGRKSQVHEIEDLISDLLTDSVMDYGLEYALPMRDLKMQGCSPCNDPGFDIKAHHARYLVDQIKLGRELRGAQLAFNAANYAVSDTASLAGAEFNKPVGATDPLSYMGNLIASALQSFNVAVMSKKTAHILTKNPSFLGNVDNRGVAQLEGMAALLGLDKICVVDAKYNSAASGAAPTIVPVIGTSILLAKVNSSFMTTDCPSSTFGFTARYGDFVAFEYQDNSIGLLGGTRMRVGVMEKQVVDTTNGFLITNAVL